MGSALVIPSAKNPGCPPVFVDAFSVAPGYIGGLLIRRNGFILAALMGSFLRESWAAVRRIVFWQRNAFCSRAIGSMRRPALVMRCDWSSAGIKENRNMTTLHDPSIASTSWIEHQVLEHIKQALLVTLDWNAPNGACRCRRRTRGF